MRLFDGHELYRQIPLKVCLPCPFGEEKECKDCVIDKVMKVIDEAPTVAASPWHRGGGTAEGGRMTQQVDHPTYYQGEYECIDLMREIYGDDAVRWFCILNAYKYRFRAGKKEGNEWADDQKKAAWY